MRIRSFDSVGEPGASESDRSLADVARHAEVLLDAVSARDDVRPIRAPRAVDPTPLAALGEGEVLIEVRRGDLICVVRRTTPRVERPTRGLSPREREIAELIADGYPNKTIASALDISPWTVATHLRRLFAKFNVTTRAEMVARLHGHNRGE
jgi:DNA-binding CsgD family transcriptional regulator